MNGAPHNLIEVRDLAVGYGERLVLEGINFEVRRGEVFAILGVSGSGKSTLLKHLIGLYQPMRGDVLISGASIVHAEGDERLHPAKIRRALPGRRFVRFAHDGRERPFAAG